MHLESCFPLTYDDDWCIKAVYFNQLPKYAVCKPWFNGYSLLYVTGLKTFSTVTHALFLIPSKSVFCLVSSSFKTPLLRKMRCFRRRLKAAADAGLICCLQQEGVPLKHIHAHWPQLCRWTDSYLHAVRAPALAWEEFNTRTRPSWMCAFLLVSLPGERRRRRPGSKTWRLPVPAEGVSCRTVGSLAFLPPFSNNGRRTGQVVPSLPGEKRTCSLLTPLVLVWLQLSGVFCCTLSSKSQMLCFSTHSDNDDGGLKSICLSPAKAGWNGFYWTEGVVEASCTLNPNMCTFPLVKSDQFRFVLH